jgi:hypothetical protein
MKRNVLTPWRLIIAITIIAIGLVYGNQVLHRNDWKKRTTPLSRETINSLCRDFEIQASDPKCNGKSTVYAPDFFDTIQRTFKPYQTYKLPRNQAGTYDEVEQKLGSFKYECEPTVHQADGFIYSVCYYDLRGDREFILAIVYAYPEKVVARITGTSKYDE